MTGPDAHMPDDSADPLAQARQARREGRLDDAHALLVEAAEAARDAGDRLALGRALAALGQLARSRDETETALDYYEAATALAREESDALVLAHRLRHIGDIHRSGGRLDLADSCYGEALALYRSRPDVPPLDLANALRPIALLRERQGDATAARSLWSEAHALYSAAGVEAGVAEAARHLGATPD